MLCNKHMTLYNITQFWRNKLFAENAECHDWNTLYNVIASDNVNHNIQNNLYSVYSHLTFLQNDSFYTPYGVAAMVSNLMFFSFIATMAVVMRQTLGGKHLTERLNNLYVNISVTKKVLQVLLHLVTVTNSWMTLVSFVSYPHWNRHFKEMKIYMTETLPHCLFLLSDKWKSWSYHFRHILGV